MPFNDTMNAPIYSVNGIFLLIMVSRMKRDRKVWVGFNYAGG